MAITVQNTPKYEWELFINGHYRTKYTSAHPSGGDVFRNEMLLALVITNACVAGERENLTMVTQSVSLKQYRNAFRSDEMCVSALTLQWLLKKRFSFLS